MNQTVAFWMVAIVFVMVSGCLYGFFIGRKGYSEKGATYLSLGCGVMVFNLFPFIVDSGGFSTRSGQPIGLSDSVFITGLIFVMCVWVCVYHEKKDKGK